MRLVLDGKSMAVGVFVGAASVASFGAMQKDEPPVGRYQVAAAGETVSQITGYVVDTATGQVWRERADKGFYDLKLDRRAEPVQKGAAEEAAGE